MKLNNVVVQLKKRKKEKKREKKKEIKKEGNYE